MGILHGRDLFSGKYITAEIKDASKRLWYVPIKSVIGDYFLADIGGQVYCFKIDNEICQYREKLTKTFRVIQYDTSHYRPVKSTVKDLEMILQKNDLPKVDGMLADIFRILGSKEKKEFTEHTLKDLVDKLAKYSESNSGKIIPMEDNKYAAQIQSIIQYLENLNVDKIVTPVRGVSEFIEDDLRATDPKFLGTVATTLQQLDFENKKVTNSPVKSTVAWMKFALIFLMIGMVGFVIYYGYEQGWFDSITGLTSSLEGFQGIPSPGDFGSVKKSGVKDDAYYQKNYTPEELRAAVDRGEIAVEDLPPLTRESIKNIKVTVEPIP